MAVLYRTGAADGTALVQTADIRQAEGKVTARGRIEAATLLSRRKYKRQSFQQRRMQLRRKSASPR